MTLITAGSSGDRAIEIKRSNSSDWAWKAAPNASALRMLLSFSAAMLSIVESSSIKILGVRGIFNNVDIKYYIVEPISKCSKTIIKKY
jgi:hypothetical protein